MKRLYRLEKDKRLAGVCSGIGGYFNIDAVIFRILFVSMALFWGGGILLYLIFWVCMPLKKEESNEDNKNR